MRDRKLRDRMTVGWLVQMMLTALFERRTVAIVLLAGVVANAGFGVYRGWGGSGFLLPLFTLNAICISLGLFIGRSADDAIRRSQASGVSDSCKETADSPEV